MEHAAGHESEAPAPQNKKGQEGKGKWKKTNKILFCEDSQENEITSHGLVGSLFVWHQIKEYYPICAKNL